MVMRAVKKLTEKKKDASHLIQASPEPKIDPLFVIFEQHLYNFTDSDADRETFLTHVAQDYLTHLRKLNISVPKQLEGAIIEELVATLSTVLTKKIYGSLNTVDLGILG
jgi:hypothetical protein